MANEKLRKYELIYLVQPEANEEDKTVKVIILQANGPHFSAGHDISAKAMEQLDIDFDELNRRKSAEYEKLEAVIGFARTSGCRQRVILDYFGDPNAANCGCCDRCQLAGSNGRFNVLAQFRIERTGMFPRPMLRQ